MVVVASEPPPPRQMTLRCGGSVRLPESPAGFTPTISIDGSSSFSGFVAVGETPATPDGVSYDFIRQGRKPPASGRATLAPNADGTLTARWTFTLNEDAAKVECGVSLRLPHSDFPRESFAVENGAVKIDGMVARFGGTPPSVSNGFGGWPYAPYWFVNCTKVSTTNAKRGDMFEIVGTFTAADSASLAPAYAGPFVITEGNGSGWVRMDHRKTIIPGSALDLSSLLDVPAGKYGWARNMGGRLEFENRPGVEVRLCGVNFCGEANYPETPERAAELAERMARLGYNALRIHHHDNLFARYENGVLVPIRENVERLDWLVAECVKRGIYLTTDLYVSRRVAWRDMGIDRDGDVPQGVFKAFQYATERGFRDWCDYARLFMGHVNPHTGRTYAEEPAMPLVCIQNETAFGNEWGKVMNDPALGMAAHWREFMLDARAKNPGAFPGFDPDSPPGGGMWWDDNAETAVKSAFWCWLEGRFYARAERFLREELGAKALLTGDNFGPTPALVQEMRAAQYGYCDVHLYPGAWWCWLGGSGGYTPPGLVKAHNPLTEIRAPFESAAWSRIWGVPFAVTEWDFVAPMPDRSMSGLLFGSMAAIQGWSATWRFAYEHGRNHLDDNRGAPLLYNLTRDPLALASDRATQLLFLRGDMAEAKEALSLDFGDTELDPARGRTYLSGPNWKEWFQTDLPWTRKVGVSVRGRNVPGGAPLLPRSSVTGQKEPPFAVPLPRNITLDRTNGVFTVATPRTCGVFAPGGTHAAGALRVTFFAAKNKKGAKDHLDLPFVDNGEHFEFARNSPTTVFTSSLDGLPLAESHRILVTHLTDAKGCGATFMDDSRLVLLRWHTPPEPDGTMPVLLREGEAEVVLTLNPAEWRVWALGSDGKRECEVPCTFDPATGALHFTASVRQSFGGCMMYEIAER